MDLLSEALLDERAQRFEEDLPLPGREGAEEILLDLVDHGPPLADLALAGLGDRDDSRATVRFGGPALRKPCRLELVNRDDHRRLVEADQLCEILLGVVARERRREDVEVPIG